MSKLADFFSKMKSQVSKYGSKKIIEKAVIIAIVGVICLIAGSVFFEDTDKKTTGGVTAPAPANASKTDDAKSVETMKLTNDDTKNDMEAKLAAILSRIKGAGKVDVMITFISGNEAIPAIDKKSSESTTEEKDKEGGTRSIKQNDKENSIVYQEEQGIKKPFVVKEILPKVKGVVIVADGAGDTEVKVNLAKATEALLDVAAHKIQVFQRNGN